MVIDSHDDMGLGLMRACEHRFPPVLCGKERNVGINYAAVRRRDVGNQRKVG